MGCWFLCSTKFLCFYFAPRYRGTGSSLPSSRWPNRSPSHPRYIVLVCGVWGEGAVHLEATKLSTCPIYTYLRTSNLRSYTGVCFIVTGALIYSEDTFRFAMVILFCIHISHLLVMNQLWNACNPSLHLHWVFCTVFFLPPNWWLMFLLFSAQRYWELFRHSTNWWNVMNVLLMYNAPDVSSSIYDCRLCTAIYAKLKLACHVWAAFECVMRYESDWVKNYYTNTFYLWWWLVFLLHQCI